MVGIGIFVLAILVGGAYLVVFGQALKQEDNHKAILFALPQALAGEVVKLDENSYLARTTEAYLAEMQRQGYAHTEQLGSMHVFSKSDQPAGVWYTANSHQYSKYFLVFSHPVLKP